MSTPPTLLLPQFVTLHTLNESLPALVDELLAVLNLGLDASQFVEVFSVDSLEVLDLGDHRELLLTDDHLAIIVVRRAFTTASDSKQVSTYVRN